jgi:anaerobic magnesium-protoporphyrin IX monomethyl ester cyclase
MPPNWGVEMPPLGIAYISAALKRAGHEVKVLDYNLKVFQRVKERLPLAWAMSSFSEWIDRAAYDEKFGPRIEPILAEVVEEVRAFKPQAVGFTVLATSIFPVEFMSKQIRTVMPEVKLFYGGPNVRDHYQEAVMQTPWVDATISGEGEDATCDLIQFWEKSGEPVLASVQHRLPDGQIVVGPLRQQMKLENLPFPDFSDFPIKEYSSPALPFSMSRGCVKRCTFCSEAPFWRNYRTRSADAIFQEVKYNVERYGIRNFLSHDSLMNGNFEVLSEFVDKVIAADLKINWQGMARLDNRMTPDLLKRMNKAGCNYISYGLESGSQKMVDLMRKGFKVDDALRIIKDTYAAGIKANVFIIVGFPKESWLDYLKTMWFLFRIRKCIFLANVSDAGIMAGSPLAAQQEHFGILRGVNFAGEWRTKFFMNTKYHRRFKLWLMRVFIKRLRVMENKLISPLDNIYEW